MGWFAVTLVVFALLLTLIPALAGILLVIFGRYVPTSVALVIAIIATAVALTGAIALAGNVLPEGPIFLRVLGVGTSGVIFRLDAFASWLLLGLTGWVAPVLIWMMTPRGAATSEARPTLAPLGYALLAVSLASGAILNDNLALIALCWSGIGLVAWLMARPQPFPPSEGEAWWDLLFMTGGPILVFLALLPAIKHANTLSLYDLAGRDLLNFGTGLLLLLALTFAAGAYPFMLWLRRVCQGVMTDAIGVLLLILMPMAVAFAARLNAVLGGNGSWPALHFGTVALPLNVVWILIGTLTIAIAGLLLLFERDLGVLTMLLSSIVLGWCLIALGTNDQHALLSVVLLLLTGALGIGTLLGVWASCEWADRTLDVDGLKNLAVAAPTYALAIIVAGLALLGFPLLLGFSGMAIASLSLIGLGGIAGLGGAVAWLGNGLGLVGMARSLRQLGTRAPLADADRSLGRESLAALIPLVLLIVTGVAPELLLMGPNGGFAAMAAAAISPSGISLPDLSTTAVGFSLGQTIWVPGVFWALALAGALIVVLTTALLGHAPPPSPVFVGGELPDTAHPGVSIDAWDDIAVLARALIVLPGPRSWRDDIGDLEGWPGMRQEDRPRVMDDDVESATATADADDPFADEAPPDDNVIDSEAPTAPSDEEMNRGNV